MENGAPVTCFWIRKVSKTKYKHPPGTTCPPNVFRLLLYNLPETRTPRYINPHRLPRTENKKAIEDEHNHKPSYT